MSARAGGGFDGRRAALLAARAVVGIALAAAASGLLAHGRGHFARIGVPDGFRVGLGLAELAAGVLFAIPATAATGAIALLVVIAWAAGLHTALHESPLHLYLYMLVVAVLAHVGPEPRRRSEGEA